MQRRIHFDKENICKFAELVKSDMLRTEVVDPFECSTNNMVMRCSLFKCVVKVRRYFISILYFIKSTIFPREAEAE